MMTDEEMTKWNFWKGKKVYIVLNNDRVYTGTIISLEADKAECVLFLWISMLDKFGQRVEFLHSEIKVIEEVKNDNEK